MNTEEHDSAGAQHFGLYGCSDKANARCNQNPDFQEGFRQGMLTFGHRQLTSGQLIETEAELRREMGD